MPPSASGIGDLSGRGLQFLLSFDTSQANADLNDLTSSMNGFLSLLTTVKQQVSETANSLNAMMTEMELGAGEVGLMALLGGDADKLTMMTSAVEAFGKNFQNVIKSIRKDLVDLNNQMHMSSSTADTLSGSANELATSLENASSSTRGVNEGLDEFDESGDALSPGASLVNGLGALAGSVGAAGMLSSLHDNIMTVSEGIDGLGRQYGLNAEQLLSWRNTVREVQTDFKADTNEVLGAARVFMDYFKSDLQLARPFIEASTAVSKWSNTSTVAIASVLNELNKMGMVSSDDVGGFVDMLSAIPAIPEYAGNFEDLRNDLQSLIEPMRAWTAEFTTPEFLASMNMTRKEMQSHLQGMTSDYLIAMGVLRKEGINPEIVTNLAAGMRDLASQNSLQMQIFVKNAFSVLGDQAESAAQAFRMGNVPRVIEAMQAAAKASGVGVERYFSDVYSQLVALTGEGSNVVTLFRSMQTDLGQVLKDFNALPPAKISDKLNASNAEDTYRSLEHVGAAWESLMNTLAGTGGERAPRFLSTIYHTLEDLLQTMREFPNATAFIGTAFASFGLLLGGRVTYQLLTLKDAFSSSAAAAQAAVQAKDAVAASVSGAGAQAATTTGLFAKLGTVLRGLSFRGMLAGLGGVVRFLGPVGLVVGTMTTLATLVPGVGDAFASLWENVKSAGSGVLGILSSMVDKVREFVAERPNLSSFLGSIPLAGSWLTGGQEQQRDASLGASVSTAASQSSAAAAQAAVQAKDTAQVAAASATQAVAETAQKVSNMTNVTAQLQVDVGNQISRAVGQALKEGQAPISLDLSELGNQMTRMASEGTLTRLAATEESSRASLAEIAAGIDRLAASQASMPQQIGPLISDKIAAQPYEPDRITRQELYNLLRNNQGGGAPGPSSVRLDSADSDRLVQAIQQSAMTVAGEIQRQSAGSRQIIPTPIATGGGPRPWQ